MTAAPHTRRRRAITAPLVAVGAVAVAALIALAGTLASGDEATAHAFDNMVTAVEGTPLPELASTADDPASGQVAPSLEGVNRNGGTVVTPQSGEPTILLFVAHWCPHCQAELPVVKEWLGDGGLPDDVELVTVATGIDASLPNYPPSEWLASEGWTAPTIADADGRAARAYGLAGYPYWVVVDGEGRVVQRTIGELTPSQLDKLVERAQSSRDSQARPRRGGEV